MTLRRIEFLLTQMVGVVVASNNLSRKGRIVIARSKFVRIGLLFNHTALLVIRKCHMIPELATLENFQVRNSPSVVEDLDSRRESWLTRLIKTAGLDGIALILDLRANLKLVRRSLPVLPTHGSAHRVVPIIQEMIIQCRSTADSEIGNPSRRIVAPPSPCFY